VTTHVKVVAVLFIVWGVVGICLAFFSGMILSVMATVVGTSGEPHASLGGAVLGLTGVALTVVLLAFSVPSVVCGWGLLRLRPWARVLSIIVAAVSVIRFPIGTLFGVYALWVLFQKDTEQLFAVRPSA
jgi:hypothetical protein